MINIHIRGNRKKLTMNKNPRGVSIWEKPTWKIHRKLKSYPVIDLVSQSLAKKSIRYFFILNGYI